MAHAAKVLNMLASAVILETYYRQKQKPPLWNNGSPFYMKYQDNIFRQLYMEISETSNLVHVTHSLTMVQT